MRQISFSLANLEDDAQVRELIRTTPMKGKVSIAFQREPSYFYAAGIEGKFNQTIIARELKGGNIIGMGSRSVKPAFINGEMASLGYLSSLRIQKDYRNYALLSRGYRSLKHLHEDDKVKAYLSTIIQDNSQAVNLLTAGRDGLPKYHEIGTYYTFVITLKMSLKRQNEEFTIEKGDRVSLEEIVSCLHRNGRTKQFYPYYEYRDFDSENEYLRGFKKHDFYVALKNNRIVGVAGKWDQRTFKQIVICGYDSMFSQIRPAYNFFANFLNYPQLPPPQSKLNSFYVSFIAVDENNPEIFAGLLGAIYKDQINSEYTHMIVGLYENDPLLGIMSMFPHIKYKSKVFIVSWEGGQEWIDSLDNRIPYLEVATL